MGGESKHAFCIGAAEAPVIIRALLNNRDAFFCAGKVVHAKGISLNDSVLLSSHSSFIENGLDHSLNGEVSN